MNINKVVLTGRWVTDFQIKEFGENKKASGRIAVDTAKKDVSHFFDVEVWGKTAEVAEKFCKKGTFAIISGRLSQETWEKDGEKRSKVIVVGDTIDLGPKPSSAEGRSAPAPKNEVEDDDNLF